MSFKDKHDLFFNFITRGKQIQVKKTWKAVLEEFNDVLRILCRFSINLSAVELVRSSVELKTNLTKQVNTHCLREKANNPETQQVCNTD